MQFDPTQIPTEIDTVEKVFAWAAMLLESQAGTKTIKEEDNVLPIFAIQINTFRAADETLRWVSRVNLELDPNYATENNKKFWQHVKEIATTTIPVGFTSN